MSNSYNCSFRFLANKQSNGGFLGLPLSIPCSHIPVPSGIAYVLGRVYCITMVRTNETLCVGDASQDLKLANLNGRKRGRTWSSWATSSGANLDTRGNQERSEGVIRGFLVCARLRLTLTKCVLQMSMSTGPPWYWDFQVLNTSVADIASQGSH